MPSKYKIKEKEAPMITEYKRLFPDAYLHCRWQRPLYNLLETLRDSKSVDNIFARFKSYTSVISIFAAINNLAKDIFGIGPLTVYDITIAICRVHKITDKRIHLCGNGPIRAARQLKLPVLHYSEGGHTLNYITIPDALNAFDTIMHELPPSLKNSKNGDDFESYMCRWQGGRCPLQFS